MQIALGFIDLRQTIVGGEKQRIFRQQPGQLRARLIVLFQTNQTAHQPQFRPRRGRVGGGDRVEQIQRFQKLPIAQQQLGALADEIVAVTGKALFGVQAIFQRQFVAPLLNGAIQRHEILAAAQRVCQTALQQVGRKRLDEKAIRRKVCRADHLLLARCVREDEKQRLPPDQGVAAQIFQQMLPVLLPFAQIVRTQDEIDRLNLQFTDGAVSVRGKLYLRDGDPVEHGADLRAHGLACLDDQHRDEGKFFHACRLPEGGGSRRNKQNAPQL